MMPISHAAEKVKIPALEPIHETKPVVLDGIVDDFVPEPKKPVALVAAPVGLAVGTSSTAEFVVPEEFMHFD